MEGTAMERRHFLKSSAAIIGAGASIPLLGQTGPTAWVPNVSPAAASSVVSTASPFVSASSVNAVRTAVLGTATNTFLGNLAEVGALPSLQQLIADTVQAPTLAQVQAAIAAA